MPYRQDPSTVSRPPCAQYPQRSGPAMSGQLTRSPDSLAGEHAHPAKVGRSRRRRYSTPAYLRRPARPRDAALVLQDNGRTFLPRNRPGAHYTFTPACSGDIISEFFRRLRADFLIIDYLIPLIFSTAPGLVRFVADILSKFDICFQVVVCRYAGSPCPANCSSVAHRDDIIFGSSSRRFEDEV